MSKYTPIKPCVVCGEMQSIEVVVWAVLYNGGRVACLRHREE